MRARCCFLHISCAIGPNYKRPIVEVPEVYRGSLDSREAKSLADLAWWEVFEDPALVDLIEIALNNNLDLEMAVARTEQAYRLSIATKSAFYPQVGYDGSAGKSRRQDFSGRGESFEFTSYMGAFQCRLGNRYLGSYSVGRVNQPRPSCSHPKISRGVFCSPLCLRWPRSISLFWSSISSHAIGVQAVEAFDETLVLFTAEI